MRFCGPQALGRSLTFAAAQKIAALNLLNLIIIGVERSPVMKSSVLIPRKWMEWSRDCGKGGCVPGTGLLSYVSLASKRK